MSPTTEKSLQTAASDLELAEAALNNAAELVRTHDVAREIGIAPHMHRIFISIELQCVDDSVITALRRSK